MTEVNCSQNTHDRIPQIQASDLKKFRIAFTVREIEEIFSVDFSPSGKLSLFNTESWIKVFELRDDSPNSKDVKVDRYGAKICKFVDENKFLHTSIKDNTIRLMNHEKGCYEFYFCGHIKEVHSLSVSKSNPNHFLSGSRDTSVRFWDTKISKPQNLMTFKGCSFVAMHPTQRVFAVAYKNANSIYSIEVHDMKFGLLETFDIEDCGFEWCDMRYSNNGKMMMVNTLDSLIMIIDMKNGEVINRLRGLNNPNKIPFQSCFTPDSRYVIGGSENGVINVWNLKTSEKEFMLKNEQEEMYQKIEFNPEFMCFATIGSAFNLWIEDDKSEVTK
ncbi:hypothetical protein PVAND_014906 [Polypedilum vanderplanki]|uniref:Uncharacterized protein n=1 Tax=Polypedilum vanderplanki TaxID=319348 RepID=A0A9J6BBI5_POLVA|nr:hypothetical protein PVAND_014906 [Polypedilum vanderplanki]